jgi:2-phosphosulfolactate phosphatase
MGPVTESQVRAGFDQAGFRARFDWGRHGVATHAGPGVLVVVVDVLSFSTAVSVAVERGARVVPYRFRDRRAADHARSIGARLAGSRRSGPGPTLSPASMETLGAGELIVLPSPNGAACSVRAAEAGAIVVAGSLRNARAVGRLARAHGGSVAVIAAGELWPDGALRPAVEDLVGAGAILASMPTRSRSPEAIAAVGAYRAIRADLRSALLACASGRELVARGFERDVEIAAQIDATDLVPVLRDGAFAAVLPAGG